MPASGFNKSMQTVIIVIHLMVVVALIAVILLQKSEGGALGMGGGGGGNFLSGRGTANVLTRTTTILAAVFFATSFILTILANTGGSGSILDGAGMPAAPSAPSGPATTNDLQKQLPGAGDTGSGPQVPISQ